MLKFIFLNRAYLKKKLVNFLFLESLIDLKFEQQQVFAHIIIFEFFQAKIFKLNFSSSP